MDIHRLPESFIKIYQVVHDNLLMDRQTNRHIIQLHLQTISYLRGETGQVRFEHLEPAPLPQTLFNPD